MPQKNRLKCKGQNNEDKWYLEPIGMQRKSHPKKKKKEKKRKDRIKPNPKNKGWKLSWKKGISYCYKSLPTMASLVIVRVQQQKLSKRRAAKVPRVVKRLLGRPATQPQLLLHCQKQEFQFSYDLGTILLLLLSKFLLLISAHCGQIVKFNNTMATVIDAQHPSLLPSNLSKYYISYVP